MEPTAAVRSVLTQYATFSGRARRSEFWWFTLFSVIASALANILDRIVHTPIAGLLVGLALLLPSSAVLIRRLHDTGHSGWWWFIGLVPLVGLIVLLVFEVRDSEPGTNRFGPYPKAALAEPPFPTASGPTVDGRY